MDGYDFRTSSYMYVSRQVADFYSYTCVHCHIFLQYYSKTGQNGFRVCLHMSALEPRCKQILATTMK